MPQCKNCGLPAEHNYCSHCGQAIKLERISMRYVSHEIFHFFTHLEKGFLYTSIQMLLSPGPSIIAYIEGKRKSFQSPVSYFLVWTTIFILTLFFFVNVFGENKVIGYNDYFGPGSTTVYAISHLSFMLTFIIPFQSFYLYILITRYRYNYFETLVAGIYAVGTIIQLQFVFAILSLLSYLASSSTADLRYSDIFKVAYFTWFTISMLRTSELSHKVLRGIAFVLLAGCTFAMWRIYVVPQIAHLFMH